MPAHSEALAIAAHLHVLLRRKTGRVTDTEWMATHPDYARAMVAFTRGKAHEENLDELLPWADKLEALIPSMGLPERKPLLTAAVDHFKAAAHETRTAERRPTDHPSGGFRESRLGAGAAPPAVDQRYVGGIR